MTKKCLNCSALLINKHPACKYCDDDCRNEAYSNNPVLKEKQRVYRKSHYKLNYKSKRLA